MAKSDYTMQQYRKFNGQTVMKALQLMDYRATTNKLAKHFAASINESEEDIKDAVKRVLSNAVANGFLVTRGKSYQLPGALYAYQADGRKASNSRRSVTKKMVKLKTARKTQSKMDSKSKGRKKGQNE